MLESVPGLPDGVDAELDGGPPQPVDGGGHRVVPDAVEPGLQASAGAFDNVVGDLVVVQITGASVPGVGVRGVQRGGP